MTTLLSDVQTIRGKPLKAVYSTECNNQGKPEKNQRFAHKYLSRPGGIDVVY